MFNIINHVVPKKITLGLYMYTYKNCSEIYNTLTIRMAPVVDMAMGDQLWRQQLVRRTACSSDIWSVTTNSRFNWSCLDWDHLLQWGTFYGDNNWSGGTVCGGNNRSGTI